MKKKRPTHGARPLHRRIALHPISLLLVLCVGVLLGGITFGGFADSYDVSAVVEAPPLTQGAFITSPPDQSTFTTTPITVTGTCPEDSYVKLFRNGVLAGTAICGTGQTTFQLQVDLLAGSNSLLAQDYNQTDEAGPATPGITVYYNPPAPPNPPSSPSSSSSTSSGSTSGSSHSSGTKSAPSRTGQLSPNALPFFVTTDFRYLPIVSGKSYQLNLTLDGGTAPYAVTVDWGDGNQSTLLRNAAGGFSANHTYSVPASSQQIYTIKIQVVDSTSQTAFLEIAEVVHGTKWYPGGPLTTDTGSPSPRIGLPTWLRLAWPAYGVVVLMVFSFWLGERQEYDNIFRPGGPRPRTS